MNAYISLIYNADKNVNLDWLSMNTYISLVYNCLKMFVNLNWSSMNTYISLIYNSLIKMLTSTD